LDHPAPTSCRKDRGKLHLIAGEPVVSVVYYMVIPSIKKLPATRLPSRTAGLQENASRRVHGVFVVMTYKDYRGRPLPTATYFRSTLEASRFLGYSSDAVGRDVRKHQRMGWESFAEKRGVLFITARDVSSRAYNYPDPLMDQLHRLFPSLCQTGKHGAGQQRTRPVARPPRRERPAVVEQLDYCI
jgi:hypothetical protein